MSFLSDCPRCGWSGSPAWKCPACGEVFDVQWQNRHKRKVSTAFRTLGIGPEDATPEKLKEVFRDLTQVWHPDRFSHNSRLREQAETKMIEINNAYSLLKNYLNEKSEPDPIIPNTQTSTSPSRDVQPPSMKRQKSNQGLKQSGPAETGQAWYKDPVWRITIRVNAAILVAFCGYLTCTHLGTQIWNTLLSAFTFAAENTYEIVASVITVSLCLIVFVMLVIARNKSKKAEAVRRYNQERAEAIRTRCATCGKESAIFHAGEEVLSETPRVKTVTTSTTGITFFNGSLIPTFGSQQQQVIVYRITYREVYECRFCYARFLSRDMQKEVIP